MNHTNEPWEAVTPCPGQCCWHIRSANRNHGEEDESDQEYINQPEMSEEDAKRIVACVNFLAGIPNKSLTLAGDLKTRTISVLEECIGVIENLKHPDAGNGTTIRAQKLVEIFKQLK